MCTSLVTIINFFFGNCTDISGGCNICRGELCALELDVVYALVEETKEFEAFVAARGLPLGFA